MRNRCTDAGLDWISRQHSHEILIHVTAVPQPLTAKSEMSQLLRAAAPPWNRLRLGWDRFCTAKSGSTQHMPLPKAAETHMQTQRPKQLHPITNLRLFLYFVCNFPPPHLPCQVAALTANHHPPTWKSSLVASRGRNNNWKITI